MVDTTQDEKIRAELAALGVEWSPTEDELPYDDGMPMETQRQAATLGTLLARYRRRFGDLPQ